MNVRELITLSMKLINVLAGNELPNGREAADALLLLNSFLKSASADLAYLFIADSTKYTLTSDTNSVSLGVGSNIPIDIDSIIVAIKYKDAIIGKPGAISDASAIAYRIKKTRPVSYILFNSVLKSGYDVEVFYKLPLATYTSLDDIVDVPGYYENFYIYGLARALANLYGVDFGGNLPGMLNEYSTFVKTNNYNTGTESVDLVPDIYKYTGFDIYAGS